MKKQSDILSTVATILFVPFFLAILFAMGIVRTSCLNRGYELSSLAKHIEERKLEQESLLSQRSNLINKENLFTIASQKGFVFKQEGRTYNVK